MDTIKLTKLSDGNYDNSALAAAVRSLQIYIFGDPNTGLGSPLASSDLSLFNYLSPEIGIQQIQLFHKLSVVRTEIGKTPSGAVTSGTVAPTKKLYRAVVSSKPSMRVIFRAVMDEMKFVRSWPGAFETMLSSSDAFSGVVFNKTTHPDAPWPTVEVDYFGTKVTKELDSLEYYWWLDLLFSGDAYEYVPLGPRRPRIYGQKDSPSWRKFHKEWADGRKFTRHQSALVEHPNDKGYGNDAKGPTLYSKAKNKAVKILTDAAIDGLKAGAKTIKDRAKKKVASKLKASVLRKLKESVRKR